LLADPDTIVKHFNESQFKNAVERLNFGGSGDNAIKVTVEFDSVNGTATIAAQNSANPPVGIPMAVTVNASSVNDAADFGVAERQMQAAQLSTNATLASLGITFPSNASTQVVNINGANITMRSNMSVQEMVNAVNGSAAGVTMAFSTLTNSFTITSNEFGRDAKIEFTNANTRDFFAQFGLGTDAVFAQGQNMELMINNETVEAQGNSYTINGTTFTFAPHAKEGEEFRVEVGRDLTVAANAIKSFVEDYNKLIDEIFGMLNEKPNRSYHFLTDQDIEDGGLSDRQTEQWERLAKQGILSNNSAVSSVMSGLRNAMLATVTGGDGRDFGIFNILGNPSTPGARGAAALRTSTDFRQNGKLELDEQALMEALQRNPDDIMQLFTGDNGIMARVERELNKAIRTNVGEEGTLIARAGLATGRTANENALHTRITSLNRVIDTLQGRLERQQDRYWKTFTAMEKQFATLNSQSNHMASMFSNMFGN
jgi:flagellar hook-associated protein 2